MMQQTLTISSFMRIASRRIICPALPAPMIITLVVGQFYVAVHLVDNGFYALIFALSNVTTNILIMFCIYTFQRMERGYSTKVDEDSVAIWKELGLTK